MPAELISDLGDMKQLENLNSPIEMHTHAGSIFDNCVTLTLIY